MDNWKPFGGEVGQLAEANSVVASGKAQLDEAHNFTSKGLQIRVLGVPQQNAKSRVETQIKICLQLVTDKGDKVPLWSHLRLPEHLVPREKLRKSKLKGDESLSEQSVLSLEAVVVCASDVRKTVSTCSGCIQRERKRTRKKEANSKKALQREQSNLPEPRLGPGGEEVLDDEVLALEQKKVLLFNCPHMVDFSSGDTILPTRITCYCRHHGEKLGFCVYFIIRDCTGQIVATGMSPPIMITDDHKSSKTKPTTSRKRQRVEEPLSPPRDTSSPPYRRPSVFSQVNESLPDNFMMLDESLMSFAAANGELTGQLTGAPQDLFPSLQNPQISHPASPLSPPQAVAFPNMDVDQGFGLQQPSSSPILVASQSDSSQLLRQNGPMNADFILGLDGIAGAAEIGDLSVFDEFMVQSGLSESLSTQTESPPPAPAADMPSVSRVIPAEGPLHGGLEVTVLGSDFYDGLTVMFGGIPAVRTHFWGATTLVCVLPPAPTPGQVPVTFKEHPEMASPDRENVMFTYKDDGDRALMELALQVLGLRMTGKLEDARQIAMRIVANPTGANNEASNGSLVSNSRTLAADVLRQSLGLGANLSRIELERLIIDLFVSAPEALEGSQAKCADVSTSSGHTILHHAILAGMGTLCKWIIANELCDAEAVDTSGFAAIHLAAWTGMWSVVLALLDAGVRRNVQTTQGILPVHLAALRNHREVVRLLLTYRPDYDWESDDEACFSADEEDLLDSQQPTDRSEPPVTPSVPMVQDVPRVEEKDDQLRENDTMDDCSVIPSAAHMGVGSRPMGRFSERPRRGKRGRGGRGGTGTLQRMSSSAIKEDAEFTPKCDDSMEQLDEELLRMTENLAKPTVLPPAAAVDTTKSPYPETTGDEKRPVITAEELLYNLTADKVGPKAADQSALAAHKADEKVPSSWYTHLSLLTLPVSLSASAFGFASHKAGDGGGFSIPLPQYSLWFGSTAAVVEKKKGLDASGTDSHVIDSSDPTFDPPFDNSLPPYTPPMPHPPQQPNIAATQPYHRGPARLYPQPPSPQHLYTSSYLDEEFSGVPCNCVSYSGTHETRCTRYQAIVRWEKEVSATMRTGWSGKKMWTFWIPILLVVVILSLLSVIITTEDIETLMDKVENVHVDMMGPVRDWFEDARRWGAGRGEGFAEWLQTIENRGRAIAKVGRLVV